MQKICSWMYELAVLLALLVSAAAPIHGHYTAHINIAKTSEAGQAVFEDDHINGALHPGNSIPVFRFNPDWQSKIGDVRVVRIDGNKVFCTFDPKTFQWPIGKQSRIIQKDGQSITLDAGKRSGFSKGEMVNLFRERDFLGKAQIVKVENDTATATLTSAVDDPLIGATATEFVYATQVSFLTSPLVEITEIIFFTAVMFLWLLSSVLGKMQALTALKEFGARYFCRMNGGRINLFFNAALGIPFIMLAVPFILNLGQEFIDAPAPLLTGGCYLLSAVFYYGYLLSAGKSPILKFCSFFRYRRPEWKDINKPFRRTVLWTLHLVIAYVFGHTLFAFLLADFQSAVSIAWPGIDVNDTGWLDFIRALPRIFVTMPHFSSMEQCYKFFQLMIWGLAIIPCLMGYGYSVFLEPFKGKIRNLDFTVAGWATTAVCYGPLLGAALWTIVPSFSGNDPITSQGPLLFMTWGVGMALNILYMLTLFNIGTLFGVMTDKGVRTTGFYSVVRHPSYTLESLMFLLTWMVGFSTVENWIGGLMFPLMYFIRSEREDHFMSVSNPEFLEYKKQVPYKYLPGIY